MPILLMTIDGYLIMAINGHFIGGYFIGEYSTGGYWWLLNDIIVVGIGGYYINGYWWLLY